MLAFPRPPCPPENPLRTLRTPRLPEGVGVRNYCSMPGKYTMFIDLGDKGRVPTEDEFQQLLNCTSS